MICRQLATAYTAGLPILSALHITAGQGAFPRGRRALLRMETRIKGGASLADACRAEEGNLWFDWYRSTDEPNTFLLCEAFREGEAPAEHVNSAHFRAFTSSAAQYLQRTPRIINTTAEGEEWGTMGEITVD